MHNSLQSHSKNKSLPSIDLFRETQISQKRHQWQLYVQFVFASLLCRFRLKPFQNTQPNNLKLAPRTPPHLALTGSTIVSQSVPAGLVARPKFTRPEQAAYLRADGSSEGSNQVKHKRARPPSPDGTARHSTGTVCNFSCIRHTPASTFCKAVGIVFSF